ncbi:MAG: Crp/Fnr family transcriptional regulator [Candidatus Acidiferrum sp.]|jgi:CRP/FNR family transcriptional regulator
MIDVTFLSGIDLFRQLPDSCLEALEKDSNVLNCSAGHVFFQPDQIGRVLFVLEKGSVRTFRTYGERTLTIAVLQPPAIFGVIGCFGQGKYISSAEAIEASRVRMISRDSVQTLLECFPAVTHKLVDLMSERCVYFLQRMETLARKGLIPRLATLLLEKADNGVVVGMTHKDMADHLGLHRESITATLGELRSAGIISIKRKTIRILHRERLERAARE